MIGAGVAGLAAARVLSRRYATVTVLDRDTLPYGPAPRRGVPQGEHPHILLVGGLRELAALFPGFDEELVALGGTALETGADICAYRLGQRWPVAPTGFAMISVTRPQLEAVLRARVTGLPGVAVHDQVAVAGLAGRGESVTGVVLDSGETLDASLVVDCSGRGSRSDRWLGSLGLDPPPRPLSDIEQLVPEAAGSRGGTVVLRLFINEQGTVDKAEVLRSTPPGLFDATALEAASRARFSPGYLAGVPVKSQVTFEVKYRALGSGAEAGGRTY